MKRDLPKPSEALNVRVGDQLPLYLSAMLRVPKLRTLSAVVLSMFRLLNDDLFVFDGSPKIEKASVLS
ncbi:MAG: hypothetical protein AUJ04_10535 [Acidobacteria bacterium 13_1_40CM_3_55_6]|nr:MAG: hypothetical protein AUJ04_10535 [Acidobacteria bacterium 13_1_40CM_3_55_6]